MILCIDIGNTNIVLGCFCGESLLFQSRVSTNRQRTGDQYAVELRGLLELHGAEPSDISGAVISSVVPSLTHAVSMAVSRVLGFEPMVLGSATVTGLDIRLDQPGDLASDLAATAVAAKAKYPLPCIIIDMGTATKITVLDENGAFLGGAIMPGLRVSIDTLVNSTSLLVDIPLEAPPRVIGSNTIDCMKSGAICASAAMLDGMCIRIARQLNRDNMPCVVATGGLAGPVVPHCEIPVILDDTLLLDGLRLLYSTNQISHL